MPKKRERKKKKNRKKNHKIIYLFFKNLASDWVVCTLFSPLLYIIRVLYYIS